MSTMTLPTTVRAAKVTLNLARLLAEGRISADEAERLHSLADGSRLRHLMANIFLIFGALMVVGGVLALRPTAETGLVLALASLSGGTLLVVKGKSEWWLLGRTLVLMGVLGLCGWIGLRFSDLPQPWPHLTWPLITVLLLAGAVAYRDAFLTALTPIALGYVLGGATAYWHASYFLSVEEPIVSVATFGILGGAIFWLRRLVPATYELSATVFWRVCFILSNFALWVGSLWGDYIGDAWLSPMHDGTYDWKGIEVWRETAIFIPSVAFTIAWAIILLAIVIVGARTRQMFLVNTAIVFLGINFYTQAHEVLLASPWGLVVAGIVTIVLGLTIFRLNPNSNLIGRIRKLGMGAAH